MKFPTVFIVIVIACAGAIGQPNSSFYVATTGNDSNPGTQAAPWRTIQHAADSARAGSTVNIRGGIYEELVTLNASGNASEGFITFKSHPGETAVLDAAHFTPSGRQAVLTIHNQSYITIGPGLDIYGESDRKTLRYCTTSPGKRDNACIGLGIACSGHHLVFTGNIVHDNGLGGISCSPSAFGASPLACRAAVVTLRALQERDLYARSSLVGEDLMQRLEELGNKKIRQVRGRGLMIGVELKERVTPTLRALQERGVLVLPAGATTFRLLPPPPLLPKTSKNLAAVNTLLKSGRYQ
jgi:hypothetical protein